MVSDLADREIKPTIVTASAGNHGVGVAFSAQKFDCPCIVYLPESVPESQADRVRAYVTIPNHTITQTHTHTHTQIRCRGKTSRRKLRSSPAEMQRRRGFEFLRNRTRCELGQLQCCAETNLGGICHDRCGDSGRLCGTSDTHFRQRWSGWTCDWTLRISMGPTWFRASSIYNRRTRSSRLYHAECHQG